MGRGDTWSKAPLKIESRYESYVDTWMKESNNTQWANALPFIQVMKLQARHFIISYAVLIGKFHCKYKSIYSSTTIVSYIQRCSYDYVLLRFYALSKTGFELVIGFTGNLEIVTTSNCIYWEYRRSDCTELAPNQ
jgi:hypothetical protein